jgi:predicted metal-binding protein
MLALSIKNYMAAPYLGMLDKNKRPNRLPAGGLQRIPRKPLTSPAL